MVIGWVGVEFNFKFGIICCGNLGNVGVFCEWIVWVEVVVLCIVYVVGFLGWSVYYCYVIIVD